jgi:hypothetical protein
LSQAELVWNIGWLTRPFFYLSGQLSRLWLVSICCAGCACRTIQCSEARLGAARLSPGFLRPMPGKAKSPARENLAGLFAFPGFSSAKDYN